MTCDGSFRDSPRLYTRLPSECRSVPEAGAVRARSGTFGPVTHDELLQLFRQSGALLEGHFRLTSGLHSGGYLQCALVLQHPQHATALGEALGALLGRRNATAVLSPALGGIVIGARAVILRGVSPPLAFASAIADVTTELMAQIVFILLGIALCVAPLRTSATTASCAS